MTYRTARNADPASANEQAEPDARLSLARRLRLAAISPAQPACEFHRRRAEAEMEKAMAGAPLSIAVRHLELAHLHRERQAALRPTEPLANPARCAAIGKTDKEG